MASRWPRRPGKKVIGEPKFNLDDRIGKWVVIQYSGHTAVNQRTIEVMSKEQHWYKVKCNCGNITYRSQQELIDPRRQQSCAECNIETLSHKEK